MNFHKFFFYISVPYTSVSSLIPCKDSSSELLNELDRIKLGLVEYWIFLTLILPGISGVIVGSGPKLLCELFELKTLVFLLSELFEFREFFNINLEIFIIFVCFGCFLILVLNLGITDGGNIKDFLEELSTKLKFRLFELELLDVLKALDLSVLRLLISLNLCFTL